jgi:hypothetical protein
VALTSRLLRNKKPRKLRGFLLRCDTATALRREYSRSKSVAIYDSDR